MNCNEMSQPEEIGQRSHNVIGCLSIISCVVIGCEDWMQTGWYNKVDVYEVFHIIMSNNVSQTINYMHKTTSQGKLLQFCQIQCKLYIMTLYLYISINKVK